ncbi:MAG: type III secretion system chaperone [Desulfobacterium sp.]|nr:type III secretion system chaperone [Desulfobacterium sp.]
MGAEKLITNIGLEFGLELTLNEDGVASLLIDDKFEIEFEYVEDRDTLFVSSALGKLEGSGNETIYRALLDANLYGQKTGGASFALDDRTNEVILFFQVKAGTTAYEEFRATMERYLNTLADWSVTYEGLIQNTVSGSGDNQHKDFDMNSRYAIRV